MMHPIMIDQTLTVWSSEPDTAKASSSASATAVTGPECPTRSAEKSQMSRFHSFTTWSLAPGTIEQARQKNVSFWVQSSLCTMDRDKRHKTYIYVIERIKVTICFRPRQTYDFKYLHNYFSHGYDYCYYPVNEQNNHT